MPGSRISRRQVIASLGVGGLGSLAGCSDSTDSDDSTETDDGSNDGDGGGAPDPRIADLSLDPSPASQTDIVTAELTIANDGGESLSGTVEIQHGGDPISEQTITVDAGGTETVAAEFEVLRVGTREIDVALRHGSNMLASTTEPLQVEQTPADFVRVDGTEFALDDGSFYATGAQPMIGSVYSFSDPIPDIKREAAFNGLDHIGSTVARVHAFSYAPLSMGDPYPGEDNETFFKRLDKAIVAAKRRGIRLSLNIIEGAPQYHIDPEAHPGWNVPTVVHRVDSADEINDFFENEECIQLYKDWVDELLTHENHLTGVEYRSDPTIMMWELGNEIERHPTDGQPSIRPWIEEVGTHVQTHLDEQLLTTGIHGWPDGRSAFLEDQEPECIDVCSLHWWIGPDHYDLSDDEAVALLEEKVAQAHDTLEKPLWIGEYNWGYPGEEYPVPEEFLEERNRNLRKWHDRILEHDIAGAALHVLASKEVLEEHKGNDHRGNSTTVYWDDDTGTVEELRRFAARMRGKSTASDIPEMPPLE